MENTINGIHHITAIAGNAKRNHDFYTKVLGQRMVKKTVNFDDPETYHLYYGDKQGTPGTILTFLPLGRAYKQAGEVQGRQQKLVTLYLKIALIFG
jgi:catechol 2,3-dioxygenase-like lactoylglutathione lyase family enzyme